MENDCHFADIILPTNTKYEEDDIGDDPMSCQFNSIFLEEKCIEPRGESRSDYEAVCAIAEKLDLREGNSLEGNPSKNGLKLVSMAAECRKLV